MIKLGSGIHANSELKKPRVPILISNKIHFKTKCITITTDDNIITIIICVNSIGQNNHKCVPPITKLQNTWTKMAKLQEKQTIPQS